MKLVKEIVAEHPSSMKVFRKYKVDFCCGGKKPIDEACKLVGIDVNLVLNEIDQLQNDRNNILLKVENWSIPFIIDYIINNHHAYVKNTIPELQFFANKVSNVHGNLHPNLFELKNSVDKISEELLLHMEKEEKILFPIILNMITEKEDGKNVNVLLENFRAIVCQMEYEHELAGDLVKTFEKITNGYKLPSNACNSFQFLYQLASDFEEDLYNHVHLENNILFAKVEEKCK